MLPLQLLGNALDFGDLTGGARSMVSTCALSPTRCVCLEVERPSGKLMYTIEYVQIMSTGNAIDFGDLTRTASR